MGQDIHTYFDTVDYVVFGAMLLISALIGVYFGFCAKQKQNTTKEYLMGGKTMGIFPISMSLIASYTSGNAVIGIASEMYVYGSQFWIVSVGEVLSSVVMAFCYIPVFYTLQITSSYEYLKVRFNSSYVRTFGSMLFCVKMMFYIPIVIYTPALTFSQVSGFSLYTLIPIISLVCVFYTTLDSASEDAESNERSCQCYLWGSSGHCSWVPADFSIGQSIFQYVVLAWGGLKAVVWTDTLQMIIMVAGGLIVMFMGVSDVGGFSKVWQRNSDGDRVDFFNLDWDPTIRHTFWNMIIGKFFYQLAGSTVNQAMVQRCLAMSTLKKAQITVAIFAVGITTLVAIYSFTGMVIYAAFHDCDPIRTRQIAKADQLLPYFVMMITSHVPALPGIFMAGVFSAALSTMSTGLNSLTGVIFHDFIRPLYKKPVSEAKASFIMKMIVVIIGVILIFLALIVDHLGGIIQASGSLGGITAGTLLGMFTLGMFFPWANAIGATAGGAISFVFVAWMSIGSQISVKRKQIIYPEKPSRVDGCDNSTFIDFNHFNYTSILQTEVVDKPFPLYTVSYVYFAFIGAVVAIVIGLIVSFLTGPNKPEDMDINLFSPVIHKYIMSAKRRRKESLLEEEQVKLRAT